MSEHGIIRDDLFTMVNIRSRSSGLPMNVWLGPHGGARHAARIKVQMDHNVRFDVHNLAVVSVEPIISLIEGHLSADDFRLVSEFIERNRETIVDHWNEEIDGIEVGQRLVRI